MHSLYSHPGYLNFKRKYQQYGPCFQAIFPILITMKHVSDHLSVFFNLHGDTFKDFNFGVIQITYNLSRSTEDL